MATSFGPGSLGIPFPQRRRYQEEDPLEAKGPKGWENTILRMKQYGIKNPWRLAHWMQNRGMQPHPHRFQEACRLAAALMMAAATESRSYQELMQAAAAGDATAACQVAAACRILGLMEDG